MRYKIKNISNGFVTLDDNQLIKKDVEVFRIYSGKLPDRLIELRELELIDITPIGVKEPLAPILQEPAPQQPTPSVPQTPPAPEPVKTKDVLDGVKSPVETEPIPDLEEPTPPSVIQEATTFSMRKFIEDPVNYNKELLPHFIEMREILLAERRYDLVKVAYALGASFPMKDTKETLVKKIIDKIYKL